MTIGIERTRETETATRLVVLGRFPNDEHPVILESVDEGEVPAARVAYWAEVNDGCYWQDVHLARETVITTYTRVNPEDLT